ncbi:3-hydroxyisobutyrate dehydrogenase [Methylocystis sp. B8]|uniref:3-hydroxyisobutyrate dehydrogenase n=1 Tax=Methylocystis sp. B8 TaxID=544938 RepID=UPI0010FDA15B|nr:3-hydroxyisobutyrate dehydrogenase [Methylocystis sp. B8]TLG78694.1 3-hydroxyisobutyrate dehydrogenase [Methylocystis sp. B8]
MARVAFIGLGNMGRPMAAALARAGVKTRGFDLNVSLIEAAAKEGVVAASSLRDAVDGADVAITMLQSGDQTLAVWREIAPQSRGKLLIDCSTIDVESARAAHRLAAECGAPSVDAPVSGGVAGAKAATLTFMCGGEAGAFMAAKPILEYMGAHMLHCGGAGMGQAAKICNNLMLGVTMIATAEAFVLAERLGLSHRALFDAASISSGQSWSLTTYCPVPEMTPASPANNDYMPGFMTALMLKDLRLAQEAAAHAGAASPLGAAATQLYALHNAAGQGGADFSSIIRLIRGNLDDETKPT